MLLWFLSIKHPVKMVLQCAKCCYIKYLFKLLLSPQVCRLQSLNGYNKFSWLWDQDSFFKRKNKFLEPNRPPISDLKKLRTYIGAGNEEAGCSSRQAAVTGQC